MSSPDVVEDRVREIMAVVLNRPVAPGETVTRETEPAWDSLRHVELIFSVEDEFEVRFGETELADLNSLQSLVEAVARLTPP